MSREWLHRKERAFFEENFKMEQTGRVSATAHFAGLYQIPVYFSSTSLCSLKETFKLMKNRSFPTLKRHSPEKSAMIDLYMPERYQEMFYGKPLSLINAETIERYSEILDDVYHRFYHEYWEGLTTDMKERASLLKDRYLKAHDIIGIWEEKTDLEYPYPSFVVELADPISTQGTSIMAERDSFSHWAPPERIITMISHEVGTHILFQARNLDENHLGRLLYESSEKTIRIMEAFSYLLNLDIWNNKEEILNYPYQFTKFFDNEITALRTKWGVWEKRNISSVELIQTSYRKLYSR